jgi:hypothetical protein
MEKGYERMDERRYRCETDKWKKRGHGMKMRKEFFLR